MAYYTSAITFMAGLYIVIASKNFFYKTCGLSVLQIGVLIFYISLGKIFNASPPLALEGVIKYSSPLPHVLMLTAIVVGFATLTVALSLLLQIYKHFKTLNEDEFDVD